MDSDRNRPLGALPPQRGRMIGRPYEPGEIRRMLRAAPLVTVTGPPGVGKSRLAAHTAARMRREQGLDVRYLDLAVLRDPDLLFPALWATLESEGPRKPEVGPEAGGGALWPPAGADPPVRPASAHHGTLLLLDNCEHLATRCALHLVALLDALPGLRVLATSRRPFGVDEERVLALRPLATRPGPPRRPPVPGAAGAPPAGAAEEDGGPPREGPVTAPKNPVAGQGDDEAVQEGSGPHSDAARLFLDRVRAVAPERMPRPSEHALVARLCRGLDGIPLALDLAAGALRRWPLAHLVDRLDDHLDLLHLPDRPGPAHHRGLRTAIGWSHELCTPVERLLWARLSVFSGSFDLEAAESVCAGGSLTDVGWPLRTLIEKSVVEEAPADLAPPADDDACAGHEGSADHDSSADHDRPDGGADPATGTGAAPGGEPAGTPGRLGPPPPGPRYRLCASVRAYGREWLRHLGEERELRRRHRDHHLRLVALGEAGWRGAQQPYWCARLRSSRQDVVAALAHSLDTPGEAFVGLSMAASFGPVWVALGRVAEGRHWLARALDAAPEPTPLRAKALWTAGWLAALQGDDSTAAGLLAHSTELAQRLGYAAALGSALQHSAGVGAAARDPGRALGLYEEALAYHRAVGDRSGAVELMVRLALHHCLRPDASTGDLHRAVALCEESDRRCVESGELWYHARAQDVHALALWKLGRPEEAQRLALRALETRARLRDPLGTGLALELLGWIASRQGRHDRAAFLLGAADRVWRESGGRLYGTPQLLSDSRAAEARTRAALGETAYRAAFRRGGGFAPADGVHRVLARCPGEGS
ncbi:ATP-binding protein [Streptomyces sp. URMC 123]|uniref:ATP-binding protein n=1 Tax=Streptomyces sp. URMC 123 TaxID=3423403 RepID=UPI003F19C5F7